MNIMSFHSGPTIRILPLRPLRPPSSTQYRHQTKARLFTHNSQLLLVAHHTPRPQLPYLSQPAFRPRHGNGASQQIARLLSTENKKYVKEQFWLATKWTGIFWTFLFLGGIAFFGFSVEIAERKKPTPAEWRFLTRDLLRSARSGMSPERIERVGVIDWASVASKLDTAIARLEDPKHEGKSLVEGGGQGEQVLIQGIGKAGFDVSAKSWPWRAGYFEALMGRATAAEHLDSMVLDSSRNIVFPKQVMIGPSNPDPRPAPAYMQSAPLEENCTAASSPPETFYLKILTSRGFTTGQRLEAARAYANWLEYKKLFDSAQEVYQWALDIAKEALPLGAITDSVIDGKTGVLKQGEAAKNATANLLRTTTDLALYHARTGNVSAALPILLSVLRARRAAPLCPSIPADSNDSTSGSDIGVFLGNIFREPPFPPAPPSGDKPYARVSEAPSCEEGELMLYIGEILFATSASINEGLGWTREAVRIADANLAKPYLSPSDVSSADQVRRCRECLLTGVSNWDAMLKSITSQQASAASSRRNSWLSWGGSANTESHASELEEDKERLSVFQDRIAKEKLEEQVARARGTTNPSGLWLG